MRTAARQLAVFATFAGRFGLLDPRHLAGEELARRIGVRMAMALRALGVELDEL